MLLNLAEGPLCSFGVGLIIFGFSNQGCQLGLTLIFVLVLFILSQPVALDDPFNLLFYFLVLLFEKVCLCGEQIDVVKQTVILFLCFNERCDYFLFRSYSSDCSDLLEGVFDDSDILYVLLH